ncbi:hypothetical protein [Amycolatopsis tucumanensis]|uniref:Uncharacterized protein n=1 Tax=Amycolatopsis tucumanensis TaxID=401106 RepID=A0ABP7IVG1_9PSEU|nr:hypothetical protein [Amycolatopsis tucumanensis]MCF6424157.1 hypothetical protein [Amycolatopsis tucumanensis]
MIIPRLRLEGFLVTDQLERAPAVETELRELMTSGRLQVPVTASDGIEQAPAALMSLLRGAKLANRSCA